MYMEEVPVENLVILRNGTYPDIAYRLKKIFAGSKMIDSAGTVFITDDNMRLLGIITAGDWRRFIKCNSRIDSLESVMNRNFRKIIKNDSILSQIEEIEKRYPNVVIVPLVDNKNVIVGAYRLKPHCTITPAAFMKLNICVMSFPEIVKQYFQRYKRILLYAGDGKTLCMIGDLLEKVVGQEKIWYVLYDEAVMHWLFQAYGNRAMMYYEAEDNADDLEIVLEPDIVKNQALSLMQIIKCFEEEAANSGEIASYNKKIFNSELTDAIEKYGVICKYVGIPCLPDLSRNVQRYYDLDNRVKIYMNAPYPAPEQKEKFNEISDFKNVQIVYKDGMLRVADIKSEFVNFTNGRRYVPNQDMKCKNTIYIIGPCVVRGINCDDNHTIGAFLQEMLPAGYKIELLSGIRSRGNYLKWLGRIKVKPGDYILFIDEKVYFHECDIDMTEAFRELYDSFGQFFHDRPVHCNYLGNKCIADAIYKNVFAALPSAKEGGSSAKTVRMKEFEAKRVNVYAGNEELEEYKDMLRAKKLPVKGKIGSIVMNCNPFTLGHRYLIEFALRQVDFLYIFVVQEDRSYFKFEDRIRLVKQGTADFENLMVLPSGKFIISADTFSEYFTKGMRQNVQIDTSLDVEIFAQHIAPVLDISVRFVGEEPLDGITRQYNESMLDILPDYGIEVEVIPRKAVDGEVVSASRVRSLLNREDVDFEAIGKLVPESTLEFLKGLR